jgi:hypothetical protein
MSYMISNFLKLSWIGSFLQRSDIRKSRKILPAINGVVAAATTVTKELVDCCNTVVVVVTVSILNAALAAVNAYTRYLEAYSFKKSIAFCCLKVISAARITLFFKSIHFLLLSSPLSLTSIAGSAQSACSSRARPITVTNSFLL